MPKNPAISIALAQCNPTVGDIDYNVQLIRDERTAAAKQGAHVVVFPELAVTGYPPEDMVLRPAFQRRAMRAVQELAGDTKDGGPAMLVGGIHPHMYCLPVAKREKHRLALRAAATSGDRRARRGASCASSTKSKSSRA